MALAYQLSKFEFGSPDRVNLEEVVTRSQKFGFAVRDRKLLQGIPPPAPIKLTCVREEQFYPAALLFRNLNDFVSAPEAAENPDLALGNAEMLCQ
jgi:hypothetical protein